VKICGVESMFPLQLILANVVLVAGYTGAIYWLRKAFLRGVEAPAVTNPFPGFDRETVFAARILVCILFIALMWWRAAVDGFLQDLWENDLRSHWFVVHDSAEPLVSTYSFALYYAAFVAVDTSGVLDHYRLHKRAPDTLENKHNKFHQFFYSPSFYLFPILIFDACFPRKVVSQDPPTILSLIGEVVGQLFFYDIYFFCIHMTLHKVPSLYRSVHNMHHTNQDLYASDTFRFTMIDFWLNVIPSILSVNTLNNHTLTRILYDVVITLLLVVNHSGYDFLFSLDNILSPHLVSGPRTHSLHHRKHTGFYAQFFPVLDWACGTNRPDHQKGLILSLSKVLVIGTLVVCLVDHSRIWRFISSFFFCVFLTSAVWIYQYLEQKCDRKIKE